MPRLLPERARIEFHYPDKNNTIAFVPFYENPEIKESQVANYAEYNPIGRAGSLYAYTGSQSRKFKVRATYTLPHLRSHPMGISRFLRTAFGNTRREQQLLFSNINKGSASPKRSLSHSLGAIDSYHTLLRDHLGIKEPDLDKPTVGGLMPTEDVQGFQGLQGMDRIDEMLIADVFDQPAIVATTSYEGLPENQVIDTLLFFMVLFRTSVVNNVSNPVEGPPILRLTHGTMYQSVPCICKSYNLAWEEEAGFDLETLTPRRLVINLDLEEIRSGDFREFNQANIIQRNNLTGWETAIASPYTTDPTNQAFN